MKPFPVKAEKLTGSTDDKLVIKRAQKYFRVITGKTKRQPYIRSAYFGKQKIFFTYFWRHLFQKPPRVRKIRAMYLPCAIELIQNCKNAPTTKPNPAKKIELLHRFCGVTKYKEIFYVQIKENVNTKRCEFISIVLP